MDGRAEGNRRCEAIDEAITRIKKFEKVRLKGETIGQALDQHAKPGRALTVNIKGTCTENVVVTADDTTLKGAPTATVTSTDPAQNTILINGASRCTIENLTVSGSRNGIAAINAGSLTVQNVEAKDNAQSGVVSFAGSRVNVNASSLHDNGVTGFVVTDNGAGFLTNSTVGNNGASGVTVQRASSARTGQDSSGANGPNTIQNNASNGVFVYMSAQSTAAGNTISGNGLDGIGIFNASNAYVFSNTITGNTRDGIKVGRSAARLLGRNTISGNGVRSITVSQGQLFQAVGDFNLPVTVDTISGNTGDGVGIFQGGSAEMQRASITGNGSRR